MNVSAIIVTRGNVDLSPVLGALPSDWEVLVWANGDRLDVFPSMWSSAPPWSKPDIPDLSVYGRYAAIEYATHDLCYVQDDDVIVSDPVRIVKEWDFTNQHLVREEGEEGAWDGIVANMPQEFRHDGYTDSCLVGFGACFHRDAPARAFERFGFDGRVSPFIEDEWLDYSHNDSGVWITIPDASFLRRTCDVVFTTLTPRVLVDVPKTDLPYATDETRMYRQRDHVGERTRMLELARMVRDA